MIDPRLIFDFMLYLTIIAAFLIGSIPFGILFTMSRGIALTDIGSGNIGATNVLRTAGKLPALLTLIFDILKGTMAVVLCKILITDIEIEGLSPRFDDLWLGIVALSAVSGHIFSIFLSFRGGKGVATGFGVMLAYSPLTAGIMFIIWIVMARIFRYSSLAAISAVAALPVILAMIDASAQKIFMGLLIAILIGFKHVPNIKRLIDGTESRIGDKTKAEKI